MSSLFVSFLYIFYMLFAKCKGQLTSYFIFLKFTPVSFKLPEVESKIPNLQVLQRDEQRAETWMSPRGLRGKPDPGSLALHRRRRHLLPTTCTPADPRLVWELCPAAHPPRRGSPLDEQLQLHHQWVAAWLSAFPAAASLGPALKAALIHSFTSKSSARNLEKSMAAPSQLGVQA